MKFYRKAMAAAAALGLSAALAVAAGVSPASATQQQICGNNGTGDSLNDWGNGGAQNPVKMYYGNSSNEGFFTQAVPRCGGGYKVTATCPFSNTLVDSELKGFEIVQVAYEGTGGCIATDDSGDGYAVMGGCNFNSNGTGGSAGTVYVNWYGSLVSVYWSNEYSAPGDILCLESGGNPGFQAYFTISNGTSGCTEWGGL
jgi:hypothetical protein